MQIKVIVVSPFAQNARLVFCEKTREGVLVDPGDEVERILAEIRALDLRIQLILATHGHIDHVAVAAAVQEALAVPFCMHRADEPLLQSLPVQSQMFGFPVPAPKIPRVDRYLQEGDSLSFGLCTGKVLWTPGHSPGGISFLFDQDLLSGDTLFAGSIGRTDLPGSSHKTLLRSIEQKFFTLPEDTRVHPGHGPSTTIGREKRHNPFFHPNNPWFDDEE